MLGAVRIVLVEPRGSANVGAVCRAMANFGLSDLVLVSPQCDWLDEHARAYAVRARPILDAARSVPDIATALEGCIQSVATTAKLGLYRRQAALSAREAGPLILELAAGGPVAIAFGPEDRGLLTSELLQFDRVLTIPTNEGYPALNLAAAVTVVAYELHLAALVRAGLPALPMNVNREPARDDQKRIMFERLFDSLDRIGFFFGQNPDHLRYALRHLLGRVDLTVNEADILIGLARQIGWYVDNHPERKPRSE